MRVTLKDIAEAAGVTKTTVSLALRGHRGVSEAMQEKIKGIAGEMGYVADPILQRLAEYRRAGGQGRIQSVIAWLNHWQGPAQLRSYREFEQYWRGAKLAARRLGYDLVECVWPADGSAKEAEARLVERGALGLLIPPHKPEVDWGDLDWSRFSLMRFGMSVRQIDSNLVTADHQRAMVMAVKRIVEYGYRRVGLVYDAAHDETMGGNLYGGFLWAQQLLGLEPVIAPLDLDSKVSGAKSLGLLKTWMARWRPDAIVTAVPRLPGMLDELGYKIPRDVALAGTSLNDIPVEAGIDQCPKAIGEIAAEMLIKQISLNERGEPADPCRILVESRWCDGKSLPRRG